MKVRIGFGLGVAGLRDESRFGQLVDGLEQLRFDSLWLSERVAGDSPDPVVGLAVAAGRTSRLKLGTSVQVLPGRNPALLFANDWSAGYFEQTNPKVRLSNVPVGTLGN